ncbi:DUF3800 domain-containing protein [Hyalangium rubrum]|uniref:DUF3800 domain-containing protein n=1 Tax=Hyalangium rubrum TaxID=3103134 RepID=A0ABU5GX64_9BACT|nr:DUF3800 domain-containing protein [Hyalangium sp. s54d21]MDY7225783.1 DUF3800 domain-containing protein [Hyalangium sp. s54d21]
MILLYIDESGSLDNPADHFAVGGMAVHESDVEAMRLEVERIVQKHLDPHLQKVELHAQPMRSGKGEWRSIPKEVRTKLLESLSQLLGTFKPPSGHRYGLFSVIKAPAAVAHADPLERTFEELLLRFHEMLVRPKGPEEFGIVVADKAKYESILQPVVRRWRESGTRFAPLTKLVEVPLFVDSRATRLIQLADFVAHAVYRKYQAADGTYLEPMLPRFDATGGKMHGLVHLTKDHLTCTCLPCQSRTTQRKAKAPKAKAPKTKIPKVVGVK